MKLAALVSGGKDSLYALKKVAEEHDIKYLICVEGKEDSELLHSENLDLVKLQSESMGVPLVWRQGSGEGTEPLREAVEAVSREVEGVVSGALASNYQREKVQSICDEFGLESLTPLWDMDEHELLEQLLDEGFEVLITKVAAQGFDENWLGRKLDKEAIEELGKLEEKYRIHIAGEGGEFETLVVDCPMFGKRIELETTDIRWNPRTKTGYLEVLKARLVE
ncbi:MAG: diphthine--ammonia ligase [Candidatus Aenigmatarchaeota archaeon]